MKNIFHFDQLKPHKPVQVSVCLSICLKNSTVTPSRSANKGFKRVRNFLVILWMRYYTHNYTHTQQGIQNNYFKLRQS